MANLARSSISGVQSGQSLFFVGAKAVATFILVTAVGAWATRRTRLSPVWRGAARAVPAALMAYWLRKRAPVASLSLATYAGSTLVGGMIENYEANRYLSLGDAQRVAALGAATNAGASTTGGAGASGASTLPPGTGGAGAMAGAPRQGAYRTI